MRKNMSEDKLIRFILGEATAAEIAEVETWVAASKENARKLEGTKIILETSASLAAVSPLNESEAWDKFKQKRASAGSVKVVSIKNNTSWMRIAAAILLLIGGGWVAFYLYNGQRKAASEWVSLKATDKVLIDTLPDGSVVHINKNSSIAYRGDFKSKRVVNLTGEAFFNVKHNVAVPFKVHVNNIDILDVGTAFNVKSKPRNTEVIVESGIVKVSSNNNAVQLQANEMVNIKPGDRVLKVERSDDVLYSYYVSNTFIANNTPLRRLVDALNEAYNTHIEIENTALRNVPITVTIRLQDSLTDILNLLKQTTPGMQIDKTGGAIIIR